MAAAIQTKVYLMRLQSALGTGLYFGGMSLAGAIASIILPQFALNAAIGALWGAIAFTIAALSLIKIRHQY